MCRCENKKMIDRPLLEDPFAQTLSGKTTPDIPSGNANWQWEIAYQMKV